jgi:hypothetical protein
MAGLECIFLGTGRGDHFNCMKQLAGRDGGALWVYGHTKIYRPALGVSIFLSLGNKE